MINLSKDKLNILFFVFSVFIFPLNLHAQQVISDYKIGVYYFPGWKKTVGVSSPWESIKPFYDREPFLGWYKEGDIEVARQQLGWMKEFGINFVVYDWYWTPNKGVRADHAINAYRKIDNPGVQFSILLANHSSEPSSLNDFDNMVQYWINNYFSDKSYLRINDKPVVYVFSPSSLENNANKFGSDTKTLLKYAREKSIKYGYKGIYFVACSQAISYRINDLFPSYGYDSISAYNYHLGLSGTYNSSMKYAHSFVELSSGYVQSWKWILEHSTLPYFLPVTAGWDRRPWGGSRDSLHDNCFSSPLEFKNHLFAARYYLDKYPSKTQKTMIICAWNEFGEGSYIEPTKKREFQYLEAIKEVFER